MPSQRPLIVPPHAILDPDVCAEFGRPVFAWHSNTGKISVAGGGISPERSSNARGIASTGITRLNGSLDFSGTLGAIVFPPNAAQQVGTKAWSTFTLYNITGSRNVYQYLWSQGFSQNSTTARLMGLMLGYGGQPQINIWNNYTNSQSQMSTVVSANQWHSLLASMAPASSQIFDFTSDGAFSVGSNSYATFPALTSADYMMIGNYAQTAGASAPLTGTGFNPPGGFEGSIGEILIWQKPQPPKLGIMLDARPDLFWWWPGKSRKAYSSPASSFNLASTITSAAALTAAAQAALGSTVTGAAALTAQAQAAQSSTITGAASLAVSAQAAIASTVTGAAALTAQAQANLLATLTGAAVLSPTAQAQLSATLTGNTVLVASSNGNLNVSATVTSSASFAGTAQARIASTVTSAAAITSASQSAATSTITGATGLSASMQAALSITLSASATLQASPTGLVSLASTLGAASVLLAAGQSPLAATLAAAAALQTSSSSFVTLASTLSAAAALQAASQGLMGSTLAVSAALIVGNPTGAMAVIPASSLVPPLQAALTNSSGVLPIGTADTSATAYCTLSHNSSLSGPTAVNLTGASIAFKLRAFESSTFLTLTGTASLVVPASGTVAYAFSAADMASLAPGYYRGAFVVTFPDGETREFRGLTINITAVNP